MAGDSAEIVIVGAGASAAAFSWRMAKAGARVVCLEQGDWPSPAGYPSTSRDWEARQFDDYAISPNRRRNRADYPVNEDGSPVKIANFNGVGGGTVLYAAHFPRFHPSDFCTRTLDGVGDDWPINYDTLAPYYALNDSLIGISGLAGDPAYPPKEPLMPPLPLGKSGDKVVRGFNALGWHWWPSDSAIASRPYDGRRGCMNLGACQSGCASGAKGSADVTYWPKAVGMGVDVRTRCRVSNVVVDAKGRATGVRYFDGDGRERFQAAGIVVLAANGIGTPRILLNSACQQFPDGLANSSGLVGKNLMFHPYAGVYGVFDEPLDGYKGPIASLMSQEFYETDRRRGFVRGYTLEMSRGRGTVSTAFQGMLSGRVAWGDDHHRTYRELFSRISGMAAICEDIAEERNTVTLDPQLADSNGIPAPRVRYTLSQNSLTMLAHAVERATEVLTAAGATEVMTEAPMERAGWHHMGTARMGTDPKASVVNEWGQCHDVRNLFIIDGSIFVTSAGVNPTCTIQALALYIADSIQRRRARLFD
jgi:choline dehydrogenase-like flavoprotein